MKRKMTTVLVIVALVGSGIFFSCQNKPRQNDRNGTESFEAMQNNKDAADRVEVEFEKFKEDIEDLSEDDPQFVDKLEKKLVEFENNMEEIGEDIDASGDKAADEFNDKMRDIRQEARELKNKVSQWSDKTGENMEELGDTIKEDFQNFKESLRDITT